MNRTFRMAQALLAVVLLSLPTLVNAQTPQFNIGIKNFGRINDQFYRGAQPKGGDYKDLASSGVKTVIDLERTGEASEQQSVEQAGMHFFRIEMSDTSWPAKENADEFLKIVNDPQNQPVYIHCHGGKHRTGIMTAIYRMTHDSWSPDQAYEEMKQYQFETGFGHHGLEDYVYDYYSHLDHAKLESGK